MYYVTRIMYIFIGTYTKQKKDELKYFVGFSPIQYRISLNINNYLLLKNI